MSLDFSQPQRQSAAGIVIMALYSLQQIVRAMFVFVVLIVIKSNKLVLIYAAFGCLGILIISLVYGYFYYLKFTFYLHPIQQEFVIDKGVFGRKQLTIPLEKIQQVNINQGFIQKLIGVYSLEIDTAGTDNKEVSISAISGPIAYALKELLLNGNLTNGTELELSDNTNNTTVETYIPFIKIDASTLLKVSLTTNYDQSISLLIVFAYTIFHNIKQVFEAFNKDGHQVEQFFSSGFTLVSVSILFVGLLVLLVFTNLIRTFLKYFDFTVSKHQNSLLISSGLFTKKNTLLHPSKVQITSYSQNYFQKKIGLFHLALKQAHAGKAQSENELKNNNLEVPGCSATEKDDILRMILNQIPSNGITYRPNFRFLNLPIFFKVALPAIIFGFAYHYLIDIRSFLPVAIIYVAVALFMIYLSYTKHRVTVTEDFIVKQSGIWDISQEILEPHKIQSITTSQYPWHKALDIGHVTLHTAAGNIYFSYGNFTEIKILVNWWLYQVESTEKDWM